jgi:ethanolamine permease
VAARHHQARLCASVPPDSRDRAALLCAITFFAVFLGYGTQLMAMVCFYIVVSLWFHFWRYRFVTRGDQFTMPWPRPRGY